MILITVRKIFIGKTTDYWQTFHSLKIQWIIVKLVCYLALVLTKSLYDKKFHSHYLSRLRTFQPNVGASKKVAKKIHYSKASFTLLQFVEERKRDAMRFCMWKSENHIYLLYAWYLSVILCLGSGISVCSLWHDALIIYKFFGILKIEWKLIKCQFYLLTTPNIKINNEFSGKTCNAGAWVNNNMSRKGCIMFWRILNYYFKSDWIFASGS